MHMCCHIAKHRIDNWVTAASAVGAKRPRDYGVGLYGSLPRVCSLACKDRLESIDFPPPCQGLMNSIPGWKEMHVFGAT